MEPCRISLIISITFQLKNHEAFKHRNEKETCTECGLHLSASSLKGLGHEKNNFYQSPCMGDFNPKN
jgi:hypothetical protein